MRLGVFAKTFAGADPGVVLRAAASAGFDCVQYNMVCSGLAPLPARIATGTGAAVAASARAVGVTIAALSGTFNMAHPDPAVRSDGLSRLAALAPVAREMGAPMVTLCTGTRDPHDMWRAHPDNASPGAWADMRASMDAALDIADAANIALGIEPEAGNVVSNAACARRLIDEAGSDRLRVVLDPANLVDATSLHDQNAIISAAIDLLADRISLAHAKDRASDGRVVAPGKGRIDFAHFSGELARAGLRCPLIAHGFSSDEAAGVARFLARLSTEAPV